MDMYRLNMPVFCGRFDPETDSFGRPHLSFASDNFCALEGIRVVADS